jgi:hypothetical protein
VEQVVPHHHDDDRAPAHDHGQRVLKEILAPVDALALADIDLERERRDDDDEHAREQREHESKD